MSGSVAAAWFVVRALAVVRRAACVVGHGMDHCMNVLVVFVSFVSVCVMECLLSMAAALSSDWPAQVRAASRQWLPVKMLIFSVINPPAALCFHLLAS